MASNLSVLRGERVAQLHHNTNPTSPTFWRLHRYTYLNSECMGVDLAAGRQLLHRIVIPDVFRIPFLAIVPVSHAWNEVVEAPVRLIQRRIAGEQKRVVEEAAEQAAQKWRHHRYLQVSAITT